MATGSDRAYLLITFDLPNQKILSTEEVVGPLEGERHKVIVDTERLLKLIKANAEDRPKDPPWSPPAKDKDDPPPKDPPWSGPSKEKDNGPPKDPPWRRANVDDE